MYTALGRHAMQIARTEGHAEEDDLTGAGHFERTQSRAAALSCTTRLVKQANIKSYDPMNWPKPPEH